MAGPIQIRELRYLAGTTFNTTHTNAASNAWNTDNSTKLRIIAFDATGLEYNGETDPTLESQFYRGRANVPLLRNGSLKFSTWGEGAYTNTDNNPVATLLGHLMGGIQGPTNRTDAMEASSTSTVLNLTSHGAETGTAVLVGARGDSAGNAECRVVTDTNANALTTKMAYSGAPATDAVVTYSTTVFFDPTATQQYLDTVSIGYSADDQLQTIGGMGTFGIEGLTPGETPKIAFDLQVADWQEPASGDRASLTPSVTQQGNQPACERGLGGFFLGDNGSTTRTVFKISELSVTPGLTYEPLPDPNGVNGIGGWQKIPSVPMIEATVLLEGGSDPIPGFTDDWTNQTAKQVLIQLGASPGKTMCIDMPTAYFDAAPVHAAVGNLAAVKVKLRGTAAALASESTANYLADSPLRIHFL